MFSCAFLVNLYNAPGVFYFVQKSEDLTKEKRVKINREKAESE